MLTRRDIWPLGAVGFVLAVSAAWWTLALWSVPGAPEWLERTRAVCFNLTEHDPCAICGDAQRDRTQVLVVEQPRDVATMEQTGMYKGVYHVLMGRLSPLDGIGPGELNIDSLMARLTSDKVREVILGTNPSIEGDGTALYLARELGAHGVKVSRLGRGLPTGSELEYVSKAVLADALHGRQDLAP